MNLLQHMAFFLAAGGIALGLAVALGWFVARGPEHATAWPPTNFRRIELRTLEVVVLVALSPILVGASIMFALLFAIPMLLLAPLFLVDELEGDEHPLAA